MFRWQRPLTWTATKKSPSMTERDSRTVKRRQASWNQRGVGEQRSTHLHSRGFAGLVVGGRSHDLRSLLGELLLVVVELAGFFQALLEVPDALTEAFADVGNAAGPKEEHGHAHDEHDLPEAQIAHWNLSSLAVLLLFVELAGFLQALLEVLDAL